MFLCAVSNVGIPAVMGMRKVQFLHKAVPGNLGYDRGAGDFLDLAVALNYGCDIPSKPGVYTAIHDNLILGFIYVIF